MSEKQGCMSVAPETGWDLLTDHLPLKCESLDALLGGGLERGIITKVYGAAGTGKTNVCLQAAREAARRGLKVAYVDTEGVSAERLRQICSGGEEGFDEVLDAILFFEVTSLACQEEVIRSVLDREDIGVVVIDTLNLFYRIRVDEENREESFRSFARQVGNLQMAAREKQLYVLVAEQVYTDHKSGEIRPFTIANTEHMMKTIIRLDRGAASGERIATVIRHRSVAESASTEFMIGEYGLQ